ncbi:hypothetical protein [Halomonas sp. LBP4]|nr:hypothetical protein [Halomonas sp. LBP4]
MSLLAQIPEQPGHEFQRLPWDLLWEAPQANRAFLMGEARELLIPGE